jgi:hypothetical protein
MEELWMEWSQSKNRSGAMIPLSKLDWIMANVYNPGYQSLYFFSREDAQEIRARGHSRGFSQYAVFAGSLVIDLDDGEASVHRLEARLAELGYGYDIWFSGGKGYHIILFHPLLHSRWLPYSHRVFVEQLCPEADFSLYQHGRLISLPGRVHEKTGKRKRFIKTVKGVNVDIPIIEPPVDVFNFTPGGGLNEFQAGLRRIADLSVIEPTPGNRHTALWGASKELAKAGVPMETTLALILEVNQRWQHPKSVEDATASVHQAYKV